MNKVYIILLSVFVAAAYLPFFAFAQTSCSFDWQCQNGRCVSGYCDYTAGDKQVQCTSNGQCGNGQVCDIGNTYTCVDSIGGIISPQPKSADQQTGYASNDYAMPIIILLIIIILILVLKRKSNKI